MLHLNTVTSYLNCWQYSSLFTLNTICGKVSHLAHLLSSLIYFIKLSRMYLENLVFGKLCICPVSILLLLPGIGVSLAGTNGWEDFHCGFTLLQRESEYKSVLFPACGEAEPGKQGIPRNALKGEQTKQQDPHSSWGSSFILEGQEMHWVWCLYH